MLTNGSTAIERAAAPLPAHRPPAQRRRRCGIGQAQRRLAAEEPHEREGDEQRGDHGDALGAGAALADAHATRRDVEGPESTSANGKPSAISRITMRSIHGGASNAGSAIEAACTAIQPTTR